jgi:XTP/dITP diphosphohydrolase
MIPTSIRFVSGNKHKLQEAQEILSAAGVTVHPLELSIEELQTKDTIHLVHDKTLKAFRQVGRPLFVEHTGLYLSHLNGLPGGLTQIFWDTLRADAFASLFGTTPDPTVTAKTVIGYTDSHRFHSFTGEVKGRIVDAPKGPRDFQWDCVFMPDGSTETFAEMGARKNDISMRRIALDKFAAFLTGRR